MIMWLLLIKYRLFVQFKQNLVGINESCAITHPAGVI